MKSNVSIIAELPEDLHESLKQFLEAHRTWDQDRLIAAAVLQFLTTNR